MDTLQKYHSLVREYQNNNEAGHYFIDNQLKKHLERYEEDQGEIEHILDYLFASNKKFKVGYKTIKEKADKYTKKLNAQISKKDDEVEGVDFETVKRFDDGFTVVKLLSKRAYELEGVRMGHCVADYYGRSDEIFSLRDKKNKPHCTMSNQSNQIKGKGNQAIIPKYVDHVVQFIEFIGLEVRDSEIANLGYRTVKFPEYYKGDAYRGKYLHEKQTEEYPDFEVVTEKEQIKEEGKKYLFDGNITVSKEDVKKNGLLLEIYGVSKTLEIID